METKNIKYLKYIRTYKIIELYKFISSVVNLVGDEISIPQRNPNKYKTWMRKEDEKTNKEAARSKTT